MERFGLRLAALRSIHLRQVIERDGESLVNLAKRLSFLERGSEARGCAAVVTALVLGHTSLHVRLPLGFAGECWAGEE